MASVNKWIGIGNLGKDPQVRYFADGVAACNISIACSHPWKDKASGERREETEWVRVVFYNRLAEIAGEYLRKGRSVYVEGRLKTRKWQDKDTGQDRYATEIVADQMQMLGGRDGGDQQEQPQQQRSRPQSDGGAADAYRETQQGTRRPPAQQAQSLADMDDDIPF